MKNQSGVVILSVLGVIALVAVLGGVVTTASQDKQIEVQTVNK